MENSCVRRVTLVSITFKTPMEATRMQKKDWTAPIIMKFITKSLLFPMLNCDEER